MRWQEYSAQREKAITDQGGVVVRINVANTDRTTLRICRFPNHGDVWIEELGPQDGLKSIFSITLADLKGAIAILEKGER